MECPSCCLVKWFEVINLLPLMFHNCVHQLKLIVCQTPWETNYSWQFHRGAYQLHINPYLLWQKNSNLQLYFASHRVYYRVGDFRNAFCLCSQARPCVKPFIWILVLFTRKLWSIYMWIKPIGHMKDFALRFALKQRQKASRKSLIINSSWLNPVGRYFI